MAAPAMSPEIRQLLMSFPDETTYAMAPEEQRSDPAFNRQYQVGSLLRLLTEGGGIKSGEPARDLQHLYGVAARYGDENIPYDQLLDMNIAVRNAQEGRVPPPEAEEVPYKPSLKNDDIKRIFEQLKRREVPDFVRYR